MKTKILHLMALLVFAQTTFGQDYKIEESETFKPQETKVLLFNKNPQSKKLILFYSKLRVNTDGTRKSYHPDDLDGTKLAINKICHAVSVYEALPNGKYKLLPNGKKIKLNCAEATRIFNLFRLNNWKQLQGFIINWNSVIAKTTNKIDKTTTPCIFQEGESKGYFGSKTSAKNSLALSERGECQYKNELDSLKIPNLVLPAEFWEDKNTKKQYRNPLYKFKAKIEDLVFAFNPENGIWSYAIIGDAGPPDNLGEGSVSLNMKLLNKTVFPATYVEALKVDTGSNKMLIAIIPNSKGFMSNIAKPYTKDNIEKRGKELLKEMGFNNEQSFIEFLKKQQSQL